MFEIDKISVKVLASFLINLSAGWFIGASVAQNYYILIADLFATTMSLYLAIRLERYLKNAKS